MISINRSEIPFHIIIMNFIVTLLVIADECDCLLTVTDKFFKRALMMLEKTTYIVAKWVDLLLASLSQSDWGISLTTISDRDFKFMSEFWQIIFKKLEVKVLASTVWHSQIDEQFERTNQIIEIALRYFIIANSKANWIYVLSYLVGNLNNFKNQSTEVSSNKILYEFNVRDTLELLIELSKKDFNRLRQLKREQVKEFIVFVNIMVKIYYDESYMLISLLKESKTYLRLHHDYKISKLVNYKLYNQRVKSFKILEKMGKLAYRLKLSSLMKIHSMIFIAQLKSDKDENPYTRN